MAGPQDLLAGLNPEQRAAVVHEGGPLLVVAGAGSGKTRVLTHRIAHLVRERGIHPYELLAITFTNKAADEMKDRVGRLISDKIAGITRDADGRVVGRRWGGMWVQTFHSACARILRAEADRLGYRPNFTIYDAVDSLRLVSRCVDELGIDPKKLTPRGAAAAISNAKNELVDFDAYAQRAGSPWEQKVAEVYRRYSDRLHRASAFDFDDLLVKTVELFGLYDDVLERYRERFRHVLVDEWQDTNRAQYALIKLLGAVHRQVMVVGDDAQSIYGFRGADIRNLLDFEQDFPDATRITLDRNYRSTQNILDAANAVIAHNTRQLRKTLWTDAGAGDKVVRYLAENAQDEAAFVAEEIDRLVRAGASRGDCAVFYRTNAQSRVLEEVLLRLGTPYQVIGGTRFYERREVKDLLAYLVLLVNPVDEIAARRVLNVPRRGIGDKTVAAIDAFASAQRIGFLEACRRAASVPGLSARAVSAVEGFVALLDGLRTVLVETQLPLPDLVELVWTRTGYLAELEAEKTIEAEGRAENVRELASLAAEISALVGDEEMTGEAALAAFLERVALVSEADALGSDGSRVTLMTVHNAKGLEYENVFVVGLEESVFPHERTLGEPDELEEERRLCYVALTRAERRLYVTAAWSRTLFGGTRANPPSRFLREIPAELIEDRSGDRGGPSRRALTRVGVQSQYRRAAPRPSAPVDRVGEEFRPGDRILHPRFGAGRIIELSGPSDDLEAVIDFDESGEKRLVLAYAPLGRA